MDNLVRTEREARGWTQAALAERLGVSRQTVVAIETGKYDPSLPLAFRISAVFGKPIEELFSPGPDHNGPFRR
ncbi:helix-turn-helix transcriptional regulator [Leifsonia sp. AG29]|uniref:helix-turn-helix transcriptional regulator n=1 Tax=Leifsonia sp. AG29 TaxID=2598860 RepID=UPI00131C306C|nr:helix-turn-helix transcriptional regulator [Leifsonia sp. AG29]